MSNLLEGKLALILGIANKWSLAYAIAQAFWREGATLALTYLGDRQKVAIEELSQGLPVAGLWPCDVTKDEDLLALTESLRALGRPLDAVVHSLAFANRDDLSRPFVETGRAGFLLAQEVSSYSLAAGAPPPPPSKPPPRALSKTSPPSWTTWRSARRSAATPIPPRSPTPPCSWPATWAVASPAIPSSSTPGFRSWVYS